LKVRPSDRINAARTGAAIGTQREVPIALPSVAVVVKREIPVAPGPIRSVGKIAIVLTGVALIIEGEIPFRWNFCKLLQKVKFLLSWQEGGQNHGRSGYECDRR
jgi:hypothetical protein